MKQLRFDSIKLPKVSKTKEGYLRGDAIVTRTGVFEYKNADGTIRRELRHPDEVFKQDSLESIKMIPVTDDHPPVFIDASNASKFSAGYTGENYSILDNKNVSVTLTVTHMDLIDKIMVGEKPEISMGYVVDLVPEKGTFDGMDYDYRQTNIKYNHLASVNRGRAGRDARFRFDGACINQEPIINNLNEGKIMTDNNSDSREIELRLDAALANAKEKDAKIELLKSQLNQEQLKVDSLEKANANLKSQIEELNNKLDPKIIAQLVRDRVALLGLASQCIDSVAYIHHEDRDVMIASINAKQNTNETFDGMSDAYIKGRFDALMNVNVKQNVNPNIFKIVSQNIDTSMQMTNNDMLIKNHIESQMKKQIN